MAHPAQREFCEDVKRRFPEFFCDTRVLEIGSRNVNGSVRELFEPAKYIGVDCEPGPGVDVVCLGHAYEGEPQSFDVVCAIEAFEHDPHGEETVAHMLELLRPDGLFFMTCAGEGRHEHGTQRTGKHYGPDPHFYRNVSIGLFVRWAGLEAGRFREVYLSHRPAQADLYFYGIKA